MKTMTIIFLVLVSILAGSLNGCAKSPNGSSDTTESSTTTSTMPTTTTTVQDATYDPKIDPKEFSSNITNKYFTLSAGTKFVYEGEAEEGTERTEIVIKDETKMVMGVKTLIYWDRVYLDGVLVEDTRDWLAQDSVGNVWYFGEEVDNYEDGKLLDHEGSWEAGVDGAKPGIWMPADPRIGDTYREEYYAGFAEDMADIAAVGIEVAVNDKTYTDCIQTLNYTPLEPDVKEHKFYCPEVGGLVKEEKPDSGEKAEIVSFERRTAEEE